MSNTFTRDPQPRIQYSGDGSRTTFGFPFPVLASDDLLVFVDDTPTTGFAINGLNVPTGGEITFIQPPAPGSSVTLLRRTEGIRETDFVDGGLFRAAAINAELDRIMLLIQENREEHNRALRGRPGEAGADFCLPPTAARANRVLGFDSAGRPMAFGQAELPSIGDSSGVLVTPSGATTARTLGEHLATLVNVRDHGALGDGVTDDRTAFEAAIAAAQTRGSPVYVPASSTPYVLGGSLALSGVALLGDGPGSTLKLALSSGSALQLGGTGARLSRLRLLGPGVNGLPDWPCRRRSRWRELERGCHRWRRGRRPRSKASRSLAVIRALGSKAVSPPYATVALPSTALASPCRAVPWGSSRSRGRGSRPVRRVSSPRARRRLTASLCAAAPLRCVAADWPPKARTALGAVSTSPT